MGATGPEPNGAGADSSAIRPVARDFTPRRFDNRSGELDIEFALHADGIATTWAAAARVGQYLGIGGPRGSMLIPAVFDWHWSSGWRAALSLSCECMTVQEEGGTELLPRSTCRAIFQQQTSMLRHFPWPKTTTKYRDSPPSVD